MKCKYVMLVEWGIETPILFPDHLEHSAAVNPNQHKPISAGFCYIGGGDVSVYGFSTSLKIEHRPEDADIIKFFLRHMGAL
jgi:hypothetical protein